jgi:hypothetical protein
VSKWFAIASRLLNGQIRGVGNQIDQGVVSAKL